MQAGTVGPQGSQRDPKGSSSPSQEPKTEVHEPSGASFLSLWGPILNDFQYHSRPSCDYAELCSHQYPRTENERIRRRRRDKRTNKRTNEQTNEASNKKRKQTKNQTNDHTNETTNKGTNERTNERSKLVLDPSVPS